MSQYLGSDYGSIYEAVLAENAKLRTELAALETELAALRTERNNLLTDYVEASGWSVVYHAEAAGLRNENAALRAELERLRQPYSRLDYWEWSALEDEQDYRALAFAFESDSRAMHDENAALRGQLAVTWQPVEDNTYRIGDGYEIDVAANGINIGVQGIDEVAEAAYAMIELPPDLRFCRTGRVTGCGIHTGGTDAGF
jgi:cell division protein FtsB